MVTERKYWFKAKKGGLGWSTPLTWQGWLVYTAMFGGIAYAWISSASVGAKLLGVWAAVLVWLPVFWLFGEPLSGKRADRK
ncbi:hypothetical protein [Roseateles sp.]|uniref:hypothetical protein n=1 Tax=Roseateles sp. TaxID=1971397 RepID=UPI0025D74B5E|nr:hypothetical protein [Roseateles sp.]MBV8037810.1 hypothetical protein [Roseateles sp.]